MEYDGFPSPETEQATPTGLADYDRGAEPESAEPQGDFLEQAQTRTDLEFQESPVQPEVEEPVETTTQEAQSDEEPPPPSDATPRAQKRIQQLANEKRESQRENAELRALVEQLKRSTDLQQQGLERQAAFERSQQEQLAPQLRNQQMRQAGLDPSSPEHQFMFESHLREQQRTEELTQLREQLKAIEDRRVYNDFQSGIQSSVSSLLGNYDVPADLLPEIVHTAEEAAAARGLPPQEAAKLAAQRYQRFLQPKPNKRVNVPSQAVRAVASTGRSGGRQADELPQGFDATLNAMFGQGRR